MEIHQIKLASALGSLAFPSREHYISHKTPEIKPTPDATLPIEQEVVEYNQLGQVKRHTQNHLAKYVDTHR